MIIEYKIKNNHADYKKVRSEVFVKEQGFKNEFDIDDYNALHLTMYVDSELIGTCRALIVDNIGIIGRIAILPPWRAQGFGKKMLNKMETLLRSYNVVSYELSAQEQAIPFYEDQGYHKEGQPYHDEHVLHQKMVKEIQ